jgi:hypothetical protein
LTIVAISLFVTGGAIVAAGGTMVIMNMPRPTIPQKLERRVAISPYVAPTGLVSC